ncbi:maleylpyruvate isomerase N-terminal domain-containing protein [Brachybacterium huguangmaarense]
MTTELTLPLAEGRAALLEALDALEADVERLDDLALLAPSLCLGWSRLDCVVHVRSGLDEMLAGLQARTDSAPTVDAASYWTHWAESGDDDPVPGILWTRRTASAYARPRGAVEHARTTMRGVREGVRHCPDGAIEFQGAVIRIGDHLASWAVELTIHHLDLDLDTDPDTGRPAAVGPSISGLDLARRTLAAMGRNASSGTPEDILRGFGRRR